MNKHLHLHQDNGVAWITMDRPERRNAFLHDMVGAMTDMAKALANDESCRIVVIRGTGKDFCSGSDTGTLDESAAQTSAERAQRFDQGMATHIQPLLRAFLTLRQPIVASARGNAIGLGGQFLLFADLVVGSETLKLILPQVKLGHVFDHGESYLLPRRIPPGKAMELALLGETMNSTEAERFGLVNFLVSDSDLETRTNDIVGKLSRLPPVALWRSKALMRSAETADFETQLKAERLHASACGGTEDFVEAIAAFSEKRPPRYVGR